MSRPDSNRTAGGAPYFGLYRDRENGWIFGVCAGIAERFGFRSITVRIIATLSLIVFFLPTAVTYLAATLLLRERPLTYCGARREQDFWRCQRQDDHWSAS